MAGEGHAERLVHKLDTFTDKTALGRREPNGAQTLTRHPAAQTRVRGLRRLIALLGISPLRGLIWNYYVSLKAYRLKPSPRRAGALRARFDRIFLRRTGFVTLDRLLKRLHANKAGLLMVLDRPQTLLHTHGSENDIRCYVTRRKLSARTRSDVGRDCRDAFLGLAKTCDKLGIAVWAKLVKVPSAQADGITSEAGAGLPDWWGCPRFCPCYRDTT